MTHKLENNFLSSTLKETINDLCFYDFPSGTGSWNASDNYNENASLIKEEDLLELIKSSVSPWNKESDCSKEILSIKKDIIFEKRQPSMKSILKKFQTLRLVNKQISVLENDFRFFTNLEALILSANYISTVCPKNLPKNLKILELYSNQLESLAFCLNKHMPSLQHLGVGANRILDIGVLSNCSLRSSLVSLDLGKNNLTDLSSTTEILKTYPNLKNLVLSGNPLSLFAIYRAYVIDSIKSLIVLDDILITADERFSVQKMEFIPESMKQLCKFHIAIPTINNIPAFEPPENAPDEPIIKTEYFVKFWFPFEKLNPDINRNISQDEKKEDKKMADVDIMFLHMSEKLPRSSAEILLNMSEDLEITNVKCFCDFLNENLRIEVIEEKKYLYSPENLPLKGSSRLESQNSKKRQPKSANKQTQNNAPKTKDTGKKKKIDESKLIVHSKTYVKLTDFRIDLSFFKTGKVCYDQILKSENIKTNVEDKNSENFKDKELKVKKTSAKGDPKKSAEKANKKVPKSSISSTEETKPIECHVVMKLLTISNPKSAELISM